MTFQEKNKNAIRFTFIIIFSMVVLFCSSGKKEWEEAKAKGNIQAYEEFLNQYPESAYAKDAQYELERIYFSKAKELNTIEGYEKFLKKFPGGRFIKDLQSLIDDIHYEKHGIRITIKSFKYIDELEGITLKPFGSAILKAPNPDTETLIVLSFKVGFNPDIKRLIPAYFTLQYVLDGKTQISPCLGQSTKSYARRKKGKNVLRDMWTINSKSNTAMVLRSQDKDNANIYYFKGVFGVKKGIGVFSIFYQKELMKINQVLKNDSNDQKGIDSKGMIPLESETIISKPSNYNMKKDNMSDIDESKDFGFEGGVDGGVLGSLPEKESIVDDSSKKLIKLTGTKRPRLIHMVKPQYPAVALRVHLKGNVEIEVVTDIYGKVKEANVIYGHPLLIEAALKAVKQWIYEPYIINGVPSPIQFNVVVRFDYDDR